MVAIVLFFESGLSVDLVSDECELFLIDFVNKMVLKHCFLSRVMSVWLSMRCCLGIMKDSTSYFCLVIFYLLH